DGRPLPGLVALQRRPARAALRPAPRSRRGGAAIVIGLDPAWVALALAFAPALIGAVNLLVLIRAPRGVPPGATLVSILIPARDEAANIAACAEAALASRGVAVEVLV